MGFLSSLFGDDGVLRLVLHAHEHAVALAWTASARTPNEERLAEIAGEWVEQRVDDPFRTRLRRAIAEGALEIESVSRHAAPDPPLEALQRFSEEGWTERLADADTIVAVRATADPAWPPIAASLCLIAASGIAAATGGLVMDASIPRFIPRAGGDERHPGDGRFLLSDHVIVSISPERGGRGWLTTLGMSRFSLPEIELRHVPMDCAPRAAWLAQAIALRVAEVAVTAPTDEEGEVRFLEMDDEMALRSRDVAAARGEEESSQDFARPALVRLRVRGARRGLGFLGCSPPRSSPGDADAWLRSTLDTLGIEEDPPELPPSP